MRLDEEQVQELAQGLEQSLGGRTAELLMKRSEPVDLSDLATKADLRDLATNADLQATRADLQALDHKVDLLEQRLLAEIHRVGRNQLLGFAAVMAVFNTGAFAAISFSGM